MKLAEEYAAAWKLSPRSDLGDDMLWHMLGPSLGPAVDDATLGVLESAVRGPDFQLDLERLAPSLRRAGGPQRIVALARSLLDRARSPEVKAALERIIKETER
jgi:hypothetical protein